MSTPLSEAAWHEARHGDNPNALLECSSRLESEVATLREQLGVVERERDDWREICRRLDKVFGCDHAERSAEDCDALVRHVQAAFDDVFEFKRQRDEAEAAAAQMREALLAMLEATAYDLWMAALHHGNQPLFQRMRTPQIGDIVMETTSYRRVKENRMGFGKLIAKVEGKGQIDTKWTIETPDGKVCNWTNADIIAIPCGTFDWYPKTAG